MVPQTRKRNRRLLGFTTVPYVGNPPVLAPGGLKNNLHYAQNAAMPVVMQSLEDELDGVSRGASNKQFSVKRTGHSTSRRTPCPSWTRMTCRSSCRRAMPTNRSKSQNQPLARSTVGLRILHPPSNAALEIGRFGLFRGLWSGRHSSRAQQSSKTDSSRHQRRDRGAVYLSTGSYSTASYAGSREAKRLWATYNSVGSALTPLPDV